MLKYRVGQTVVIEPHKGNPIACRVLARNKITRKYQLLWSKHEWLNRIWIPEKSIKGKMAGMRKVLHQC